MNRPTRIAIAATLSIPLFILAFFGMLLVAIVAPFVFVAERLEKLARAGS